MVFTADGRWLVSAGYDNVVRVWDVQAGDGPAIAASATVLAGHAGLVSGIALADDGAFVVSGSYDRTARLWPLRPDDLVPLGCAAVGRSLTADEWRQSLLGSYRATCGP